MKATGCACGGGAMMAPTAEAAMGRVRALLMQADWLARRGYTAAAQVVEAAAISELEVVVTEGGSPCYSSTT